jgi:hypothetical protein
LLSWSTADFWYGVHLNSLFKLFWDNILTGKQQEAAIGVIHLSADDPDTVERMIKFFYTTEFSDGRNVAKPQTSASGSPAITDRLLVCTKFTFLPIDL